MLRLWWNDYGKPLNLAMNQFVSAKVTIKIIVHFSKLLKPFVFLWWRERYSVSKQNGKYFLSELPHVIYSKIQWRVSAEMVSMYSSSLYFSEILLLILGMMQAFVPNMMFAKAFRSIMHPFLSISCPKCSNNHGKSFCDLLCNEISITTLQSLTEVWK